jgi:hypothetical protein
VPPGRAFDPVRRALEAIDVVHGDGVLPLLPVIRTRGRVQVGAYEWNSHTGESLRLSFSVTNDHPELSVVHEVGHFLDHQALGHPGGFASGAGDLVSVMRAIDHSAASEALRALRGRRRSLIWERGRRRAVQVKPSLVEYLLSSREQFARAYAQFIAMSSQSPELLVQLRVVRQSRLGAVYHAQWDDDDFRPIQQQLNRLLRRLRWISA